MYYSPSTKSFYDESVHGNTMPHDVVEITKQKHEELLAFQSSGKIIEPNAQGEPCESERPDPTESELQKEKDTKNRLYLKETDWYVVRQMDDGTPIPEDVKTKRAEARAAIKG